MDSKNNKDLMVSDVFGVMAKMIFSIILIWVCTVIGFMGYIFYKDYKFNETVTKMNQQYTDFINSFEFDNNNYTQDGYGNNIVGDNNTAYGSEGTDKKNEEEKRKSEVPQEENIHSSDVDQ